MGTNAWNTFVLKVEHPNIVGKSEKYLDMGELTFYAENVTDCSSKPKCMFSISNASHSRKLHKKHSLRIGAVAH